MKYDGCTGRQTGSGCITVGGTVGLRGTTSEWIGEVTGYSAYVEGDGHVTCKMCVGVDGHLGKLKCKGEYRFKAGVQYLGNWFHAAEPVYEYVAAGRLWDW